MATSFVRSLITVFLLYWKLIFVSPQRRSLLKQSTLPAPIKVDFCDLSQSLSCGPFGGICMAGDRGNRCQCPNGWMGKQCKRPCQDVYKKCIEWAKEGKCDWTRKQAFSFFGDNCAFSCGTCRRSAKVIAQNQPAPLKFPLAAMLEPLAWLIGRWETNVREALSNSVVYPRFPTPFQTAYTETLDIFAGPVNEFDRPSLTYHVRAVRESGSSQGEEHIEFGFVTTKPAKDENNGFLIAATSSQDQVGIELTSNTGVMSIEEGIFLKANNSRIENVDGIIILNVKNFHAMPSNRGNHLMKSETVGREFRLVQSSSASSPVLEERICFQQDQGRQCVSKMFRRVYDYLRAIPMPAGSIDAILLHKQQNQPTLDQPF